MKTYLDDYHEMLESLYFLSGRGSFGNKVKYSMYFMMAMLAPLLGVASIITTIYLQGILK